MRLTAIMLTMGLTACGGTSAATTTTEETTPVVCLIPAETDPPATGAVRAESGVWVLATADGAAWVTFDDPTEAISRLVLPLNQAARDASIVGVDVPAGAPAYQGITGSHPAVAQAVDCAR